MARTKRRKKRTHVPDAPDGHKGPKTFVFWRGRHGPIMKPLEADLRRMMSPNTATRLKESKRNSLRDFVDLAGPLGVSHFFILTATTNASYLRLARPPRGPTLALRIRSYALMRDVLSSQARPRAPSSAWATPPLVVLQNFPTGKGGHDPLGEGAAAAAKPAVGGGSADGAALLAAELFRSAFPPIDVRAARLAACRRVVLLSYEGGGRMALRHYSISARPAGVSPGVRSLISRRALPPGAGAVADVADLLAAGSESEGEPDTKVTLAAPLARAGGAGGSARVRVHELGPRLDLEAVKAEGGLCGGPVLFHAHEARSAADVAAGDASAAGAARARAARRAAQEANVARKRAAAARAAAGAAAGAAGGGGGADAAGGAKKKKQWWEVEADDAEAAAARAAAHAAAADEDVAEYVRQVGAAPDSLAGLSRARTAPGRGGGRGRGGGDGGGRGRGGGGRGGRGGPSPSPPQPSFAGRPKRGAPPPPPDGRAKRGRR